MCGTGQSHDTRCGNVPNKVAAAGQEGVQVGKTGLRGGVEAKVEHGHSYGKKKRGDEDTNRRKIGGFRADRSAHTCQPTTAMNSRKVHFGAIVNVSSTSDPAAWSCLRMITRRNSSIAAILSPAFCIGYSAADHVLM